METNDGSPMTPAKISTATASDAERVGDIMSAGFEADPVMCWVFGDDRRKKLKVMFEFLAEEGIAFGATHLLGGACAKWTPPNPPAWPTERVEGFMAAMGEVAQPDELGRLGAMENLMREHHPKEPHWYLGAVACEPVSQGRGLGSELLDHGLAVVDAGGMPAYLESTNPRNQSLYVRKGFEPVGEMPLPDGPSLTSMWRPAR
ncbi:MAG: GNAT family N-acetyltransferase [Acidimicrobiales bacterium]